MISEVKTLGSFTLPQNARLLGKGSFGQVRLGHVASDPSRRVAVKMSRVALKKTHVRSHTENEIEIMTKLSESECANLVRMFYAEVGVDGVSVKSYIVMEYCRSDLYYLQNRKRLLVGPELAHLTREVTAGLEALRKFNVVHRDIKPDNIFACHSEAGWRHLWQVTFKIGDFGMSRITEPDKKVYKIGGSKSYIAPEVVGRLGADHRSDLWSLGVILYGCYCGRQPLHLRHLNIKEIRVILDQAEIDFDCIEDPRLKDLLRGLLKKNPHERMTTNGIKGHAFLSSDKLFRSGNLSDEEVERRVEDLRKKALDKYLVHYNGQINDSNSMRLDSYSPTVSATILLLVVLAVAYILLLFWFCNNSLI